MDSYELTDSGVVTNNSISLLTFVFEVLWITTNNSTCVNMAVLTNAYAIVDSNIAVNNGTFSDLVHSCHNIKKSRKDTVFFAHTQEKPFFRAIFLYISKNYITFAGEIYLPNVEEWI